MAATNYRPGSALTASPAEIARRNGVTPRRQPSPRVDGDIDAPLSAPKEWHHEMAADDGPIASPPPALKGAVKVAKFPSPSQYPFAEIAADGGIWRLDPAAFTWRSKHVAAPSIRQAALNWASKEG